MSAEMSADSVVILSRALDQAGDVLAQVHPDQLGQPTPCSEWTVAQLVDHLVASPANFLTMMQGGQPDWGLSGQVPENPAAEFRARADDLIHAWHQQAGSSGAAASAGADWQTPEIAVHTWDLATALGIATDQLDPEVAERSLSFMQANLTDENRGAVFAPAHEPPQDATAHERLAAFAGRTPQVG